MLLQNLHTHTTYGDGKNTPEEMVLGAISSGCCSLGFSEHSPMGSPDGDGWAMRSENMPAYRREVLSLGEKYAGKFPIFLGLELDMDSPAPGGDWDYLHCSCHGIWVDGVYRSVDYSADCTRDTIRQCFSGDPYAYTAAYFRRMAQWADTFPGQIVGHIDLVTKFNEGGAMFDEGDRRYLAPAMEAIEARFKLGVTRVIIGTKAVENPEMLREAVVRFGAEHIAAGIDAKNGMVAIQGWEQVSEISAMDLAMKMKEMGVRTIIYTDISRDGMLSGPNVEATKALSDATGLDIVASGGVSCMEDLHRICEAKIHGAIIGKALYEERIDLEKAVALFEK